MSPYLHTIKPKSDFIRAWPYPYKAGMTISNDAEFMSFEFFETLMGFLNGNKKTLLGDGLNLNISSSMFFYTANSYNFSYFNGRDPGSLVNPYASRLHEYIKSKYIDTIHAYGDFDGVGGFTRKHAENTFNALNTNALSMDVFTNHGGIENWQNIGIDAGYHRGDVHGHTAYHSDLMIKNNVRFVWTDTMTTLKPSKKQQIKNSIKTLIGRKDLKQPSKLLHNVATRDGNKFIGFLRFRSTGLNAPNLSSFKYQLDQIDWKRFYKNQCAIIIYQHLGVLERLNGKCTQATIEYLLSNQERYLSGFYKLKEEKESGRLWLAGTSDFLNYLFMLETTDVLLSSHESPTLINDQCSKDPKTFFQGLTIFTNNPLHSTVVWQGQKITCVQNPPDETGRMSITIPIQAKGDLWS